MQLTLLPLLALAWTAVTLPTTNIQQDIGFAENSMRTIVTKLDLLTQTLKSLDPSRSIESQWPKVKAISHEIADQLEKDAAFISDPRQPLVGSLEATTLLLPISNLEAATDRTVDQWIALRNSILREKGGQQAALDVLEHMRRASGTYADALLSKQPSKNSLSGMFVGPAGEYLKQQSQKSIDRAISAYRPQNQQPTWN